MATLQEIEDQLAVVKRVYAERDTKRAARNQKFTELNNAQASFDGAQAEYLQSVVNAKAAELELQRLNDEHVAGDAEEPV
jgi:hypothetical protein